MPEAEGEPQSCSPSENHVTLAQVVQAAVSRPVTPAHSLRIELLLEYYDVDTRRVFHELSNTSSVLARLLLFRKTPFGMIPGAPPHVPNGCRPTACGC